MRIGMIGLGRMGGNMTRRLMKAGHACVVYSRNAGSRAKLALDGAIPAGSTADLVEALGPAPRTVWLMLPAGAVTEAMVDQLAPLLGAGDIIVDGGNSFYKDDIRRARTLAEKGIRYVDCGTSGGIWGLERGNRSPRPDLRCPGARAGRHSADAGPGGWRSPGRARLSPCRPVRRRAFRQDGAQRHRIRADAGLCRRLRHPAQQGLQGSPGGRALHSRPAGYRRSLAARQRDLVLAARSRCRGTGQGSAIAGLLRFRSRFGRRALDGRGRNRRSGPGRGADHGAVRPVPLAPGPHVRRKDALGHALRLRRPCRGSRGDLCRRRPDGSARGETMSGQRGIRLLLADVDGTLVTDDKVLSEDAIAVSRELRRAGIALALVSSRPPRGLRMLVEPLALDTVIAGCNGGVIVNPDLSVIETHLLDSDAAGQAVDLMLGRGLDVWVYTAVDWLVRDGEAPHVAREAWILKFDARAVASFTAADLARAVKIVGVSDDPALVAACERVAQDALGETASATRSQSFFLDVTHPEANKGAVAVACRGG